jgi:hypothetical protein
MTDVLMCDVHCICGDRGWILKKRRSTCVMHSDETFRFHLLVRGVCLGPGNLRSSYVPNRGWIFCLEGGSYATRFTARASAKRMSS